MGLNAQNVAIVPTPSGILDGHFPDGNDGTAGIPLTWATVPSFLQKQVGTPFSVQLFTLYLTQPGGATASVSVGALSGGWTLSSAGLLSYDGVGQGTGTIRVRATITGPTRTSDSNLFTYESIPVIVSSDTIPPTIPTGFISPSKTTTTVTVNTDVPADPPTATIPASGLKEVRYFKGGIFDGVTSYTPGLLQRLTLSNVATSSGTRKTYLGHYVAIGATGGGVSPATVQNAGPITAGTQGLSTRYSWRSMETSQGTYDFSDLIRDLKACSNASSNVGQVSGTKSSVNGGVGPAIFAMVITKTFGGLVTVSFADAQGNSSCTISPEVAVGQYGALFAKGATDVLRMPVTVTHQGGDSSGKGTAMSWTNGALPGGTAITSADLVPVSTNPLPDYLVNFVGPLQTIPYHGNIGNGWVAARWATFYQQRLSALAQAMATTDPKDPLYPNCHSIDTHPNFAGISTQETANNGAEVDPAYTQAAYESGLIAESNSISAAFPSCRHLWFMNFMASAGSGETVTTATAHLKNVAAAIWQNGAIVCGPDLVTSGTILTRCYPVYTAYHDGTAGAAQLGPGYTGCSIQNAEWTGQNSNGTPFAPADGMRKMEDLYQYGQIYTDKTPTLPWGTPNPSADSLGRVWTTPSGLKLDYYLWNQHATTNNLNENFTNAAAPLFISHPPPVGSLTAPSGGGMPTGVVSQNGADYTVQSSGYGIATTDDQWGCASNSVNADVTVICKFNGLTGTDLTSSPVMGISIRALNAPQSAGVYLVATASQLRSRYRLSLGSPVVNLVDTANQGWNVNKWVKITRAGNVFNFFYSTDGNTWIAVGTVTVAMVPTVYVQLFAGTTGTGPVTASFQQVNIQQLAKINYTFTGLTTATQYTFTAVARDLALNDSGVSTPLVVTTS